MTEQEEMVLRELAAKPHYIAKVQDVLGPLSLWSSQGLQDHVRKAVQAEREALEVELLKLKKDVGGPSQYIQGRWDLIGEFQDILRARGEKA